MAPVTNHQSSLTSSDPTATPPPQPPRSSFGCHRHPQELFAGICPSCLCERLATLDPSSNSNAGPSSSRRPSIKALFNSKPPSVQLPKPSNLKASISLLFPELRRTKSFSASENEEALFGGAGLNLELQRKSCDVRARSTLWSLFEQEKEIEETENVGNEDVVLMCDDKDSDDGGDEIRPVRESNLSLLEANKNFNQIEEEEEATVSINDSKAADANSGENRGKKGSGGGLWAAASLFSKKWQKWRHKQKVKKNKRNDTDLILTTLPVEKSISRQCMETQSEIVHYSFGRRSCDTDPRFSLDAARISFDEPRASWDGYLIWKSVPTTAPKASVLEEDDGPLPVRFVPRSDTRISVEDMMPGGSMQTKEYYADCSSRKRKSLDRSGLVRRRTTASVVAVIDEPKLASNATVSPSTTDYLSLHSLRDADSEAFELGDGGEREELKKTKKWNLKLWGFMKRRHNGKKDENVDRSGKVVI